MSVRNSPSRVIASLLSNNLVRVFLIIIFTWFLGSVLLWVFEHEQNPDDFSSIGEAFWNMAVYLFSGLDKGAPRTAAGRILATIILVSSLGVVGFFTASIASMIIAEKLKGRFKMPSNLKDHIVICGWNDRLPNIIREIHNPVHKTRRKVVIVAENADEITLPEKHDDDLFADVHLVKGSPSDDLVLEKTSVISCYSCLILADQTDIKYADGKSILTAIAVKNISRSVYVVAEVTDASNIPHFKKTGVDEIISSSHLGIQLMSQSAITHGITRVYNDLLTFSDDTNELYLVDLPHRYIGIPFSDLMKELSSARDEKPIVPLGIKRNGRCFINPRNDEVNLLEKEDQLFVISFDRPDFS